MSGFETIKENIDTITDGGVVSSNSLHFNSDIPATFGGTQATPKVKLVYETADANANCLGLIFDFEGGATDVPVLYLGDSTVDGTDVGLFNGIPQPTFAVLSSTGTTGAGLTTDTALGAGLVTYGSSSMFFDAPGSQIFFFGAGTGSPRIVARAANGGRSYIEMGESTNTRFLVGFDGGFDQNMFLVRSTSGEQIVLGDYDSGLNRDYDHAAAPDPTFFPHSVSNPDTTNVEFGTISWREVSIGGGNGSYFGLKQTSEVLTITAGTGMAGVATSGNLAPANSMIMGTAIRVTQAPGGGATTIDLGVTGGGNLDQLIDGVSTALNTTANSAADNDGTQLPILNDAATTLTLTTDADVTGASLIVRIIVYYFDFTEPAA